MLSHVIRQNTTARLQRSMAGVQLRSLTTVASASQKVNIFHVQQIHASPIGELVQTAAGPKPKLFSEVSRCQYQIAKFLLTQKNAVVVNEGQTRDYNAETLEEETDKSFLMKEIFAEGLPEDFEQLTSAQCAVLHRFGAARTLFYRGMLEKVYKATRPEINQRIMSILKPFLALSSSVLDIPPHLWPLIRGEREREALWCSKVAAARHLEQEVNVLLIYGYLHDFDEAISQRNDPRLHYAGAYDFVDSEFFQKSKAQDAPRFFSPAQHYNPSPSFKAALEEYALEEHIRQGRMRLREALVLHEQKPWVLKALGYYNFSKAFQEGHVSLEQLEKLTEAQVDCLKNTVHGAALKNKILAALEENKKPSLMV